MAKKQLKGGAASKLTRGPQKSASACANCVYSYLVAGRDAACCGYGERPETCGHYASRR